MISNRLLRSVTVILLFYLFYLYTHTHVKPLESYIYRDNTGIKKLFVQKLFYIYNWSDDVIDRWPRVYTHERLGIEEKYKSNFGIGEAIDDTIGLYDTHQYSLFRTFYYRLSESKYRTHDPKQASIFFIPYDIGMDCSINNDNGGLMPTKCPMMKKVLDLLKHEYDDDHNDLEKTKVCYFNRNSGHDHFLLLSINQPMWHFINHKNWDLYKACFNCTKLSIDTYPKQLFKPLQNHDFLNNNWHSIPFPSSFHNNKNADKLPWKSNTASMRQFPLSLMGSLKITSKVNRNLREILMDECSNRPKDCLLNKLDSHDSQSISNSIRHMPYAKSVLCLMPGGDFPSRKGVLDAMLFGCIPVVFNLYTAHYQMPWFWNMETANDCMIYIDRHNVTNSVRTVFDQLVAMSVDSNFIVGKLKCISRIGQSLQYNAPFNSNVRENDAVDIVIERLLQKKHQPMIY